MIGAFAAFGVNLDLAVLAVLSYRAISFWLPTPFGAAAYLQLRRAVARWRDAQSSGEIEAARAPAEPGSEGSRAGNRPGSPAILYKVK
jgi:hypothetical protein